MMRLVRKWGAAAVLASVLAALGAPVVWAQLDARLELLEREVAALYDGRAVSLEQCVTVALVGSNTLGRTEEDLRSAAADRRAALAAFLPDLRLTGFWQRQERTDLDQDVFDPVTFLPTGETEDVTSISTFHGQTLRSALTIFNGFSRFANRNQANAAYAATEANEAYQRELIRESVTNSYYDLVRAQQRVTVAMDAEELARRELERSETYFDLGISTRADVLQAKVRHQQTKLDVVRERNGERNAFAALVHAMNLRQARRFEIEGGLPALEGLVVPEIDALVERARDQRLDLEASRFTLDARESGITVARSGYYPSIEVFGQWARNVSETPQSLRFGAQENHALTWGVQGSWDIFDRLQTQQQSRRAVADRRKAEYDLRQSELDMELEIVQLHNNLVEAVESYDVSTVTVEQSQEDLRLAEERFRVGAGTSLDVITAQVNLAQARRDLVDAEVNIMKFRNQLGRAVGGNLPE